MLALSELLTQSLELYKKHFKLLAGYAAWLLLPYAAMVLISLSTANNLFLDTLITLCNVAQGLVGLWLVILIPLLIRDLIKTEKISITNQQTKVWQILPSVVFVALLEALVILGGFILLIVPGIIFWVWFSLSQMAAILDNKKGTAALSFSRELVRGKFWPVLWRLLIGPAAIVLTATVISGLIIMGLALITGSSFDTVFGPTPPLWADIIATVLETFVMPLVAVYMTLLYLDITKNKTVES
ncbi:MAG: hypothetical protein V1664_02000 [Candidatus Uhrbacteria bacterium]